MNLPIPELKKALEGKKLVSIDRNGKELFFNFVKKQVLSFHLMLHGDFNLVEEKTELKYKILVMTFSNKTGLALTDFQKSATIKLNPEMPEALDALSRSLSLKYFTEGLQKSKAKKIKEVLTDQKFIRGIGNAYADEILWRAKIHPLSVSGKITEDAVKVLHKSIRQCLIRAEKKIKKEYPDIISGEKREFMEVHNSSKKVTTIGSQIKKLTLSGRSTYYTDEQILYK